MRVFSKERVDGTQLLLVCVPIPYLEISSGIAAWWHFLVNLQFYSVNLPSI